MFRILKKLIKAVVIIILAVVIFAAGFLGYLTITEYSPDSVEKAEITENKADAEAETEKDITVISWNIGYGALGKNSDFIMDGGGNAPDASKEQVQEYLSGIKTSLEAENADIYMLQEVDKDSSRSYGIDEREDLKKGSNTFVLNYSCPFVPYPWPPIGKVNSGLFTASDLHIADSERIALPCPFSWPLRIANLKRALMVSRIPVSGSEKELVIINLHLEAYTDPEGREGQMKLFLEFIRSEYAKGNYVIAGGDFNQCFPGTLDIYPNRHEDLWTPGALTADDIPEGFTCAFDASVPTCRLLNQPYDPADEENTQYYVIDGFIVSQNVNIKSVATLDKEFQNTDHNPVKLVVSLNK